jgi:hypothetical protein
MSKRDESARKLSLIRSESSGSDECHGKFVREEEGGKGRKGKERER